MVLPHPERCPNGVASDVLPMLRGARCSGLPVLLFLRACPPKTPTTHPTSGVHLSATSNPDESQIQRKAWHPPTCLAWLWERRAAWTCPPAPLGWDHSTRRAPQGWAASLGKDVPSQCSREWTKGSTVRPSSPAVMSTLQLTGQAMLGHRAPWGRGASGLHSALAEGRAGTGVSRGAPQSFPGEAGQQTLGQLLVLGPQPGPQPQGCCHTELSLSSPGSHPLHTIQSLLHAPNPAVQVAGGRVGAQPSHSGARPWMAFDSQPPAQGTRNICWINEAGRV